MSRCCNCDRTLELICKVNRKELLSSAETDFWLNLFTMYGNAKPLLNEAYTYTFVKKIRS